MKKSHTARNISLLSLIVAIGVVAIALSGALSTPQAPSAFVMIVHVYDQAKGNPQTVYDLTEPELIQNVNVTVSGPNYPPTTRRAPSGIVAFDQLSAGTYQITVSSNGYVSSTVAYLVGPNCLDRTPDGQCHPLVPMTKVS